MHGSWRLVGSELYDLKTDPAQRVDLATKHPQRAARLRADYEAWWRQVSERADEHCPFVIDPLQQRTVMISSQNYLGGDVVYSQRVMRMAKGGEGWTVIDVAASGRYRIALRRWPRESGLALGDEAGPYPAHPSTHTVVKAPGKSLHIVKARLQVGRFDKTVAVKVEEQEVGFDVDLARGQQRIQTWFTLETGEQIAAYYFYIEPYGEPHK